MPRRARRGRGWALLVAVGLLAATAAALAGPPEREKTDVVVMANGDRLTGRILYVQYGILQLSSKHSGSVAIEWPSVRAIISTYRFRVERFGGQFAAGIIVTSPDGATLIVSPGEPGEISIPMAEVARVLPYDTDFWHRVDGSASVGYNYTKSTQVSQASAAFSAHYADERIEASLDAHTIINKDSSGTSDQDQLLSTVFFLSPRRSFWGLLGEWERNQSLGIDSRLVGGPLVGTRLYQSLAANVIGVVGVVYDKEWPTGGSEQGSTEGVIAGQWRIYKFIYPKVSLDFSVMGFPSISDAPRFRASANLALTLKVTDRFALTLTEYGNYDSRPPGENEGTSDYGVTAALTYNFGYVIP